LKYHALSFILVDDLTGRTSSPNAIMLVPTAALISPDDFVHVAHIGRCEHAW